MLNCHSSNKCIGLLWPNNSSIQPGELPESVYNDKRSPYRRGCRSYWPTEIWSIAEQAAILSINCTLPRNAWPIARSVSIQLEVQCCLQSLLCSCIAQHRV